MNQTPTSPDPFAEPLYQAKAALSAPIIFAIALIYLRGDELVKLLLFTAIGAGFATVLVLLAGTAVVRRLQGPVSPRRRRWVVLTAPLFTIGIAATPTWIQGSLLGILTVLVGYNLIVTSRRYRAKEVAHGGDEISNDG